MDRKELEKKVAYLEFVNDQLDAEMNYINDLLIAVGFTDGLESVKEVAHDMINERIEIDEER